MLDVDSKMSTDDALAQPSWAHVFELLAELKHAAKTTELAARLDMHPNGVRRHLERLQDAGLVDRARVQGPRGRPADAWMVAPGARPAGRAPRAYRDLGRWLARSMSERSISLRGLERTGREIGRELAPSQATPGLEAVQQALAALGFAPVVQSRPGDRVTICLGNCPYHDVVRENQPAVCALHKGITRGLLDVLAPGTTLERFVPRDPARAGCLLELRGNAEPSRSAVSGRRRRFGLRGPRGTRLLLVEAVIAVRLRTSPRRRLGMPASTLWPVRLSILAETGLHPAMLPLVAPMR